jgi:transposase
MSDGGVNISGQIGWIGGDIVGRDKIVVPSHIDDALRSVLDAIAAAPPRRLLAIVRDDDVCRRLMTVPGVGPVVALTYR